VKYVISVLFLWVLASGHSYGEDLSINPLIKAPIEDQNILDKIRIINDNYNDVMAGHKPIEVDRSLGHVVASDTAVKEIFDEHRHSSRVKRSPAVISEAIEIPIDMTRAQ